MKTTAELDNFINASLLLDYSGYTLPTTRGDIFLSDFTDTSAKVAFEQLDVDGKHYLGTVTLVRNDGVWSAGTGISDRKITDTETLTPAEPDVTNSIHQTLILAVQFWYVAQPATVKMRELQITIQQKDTAKELAMLTIQKLKRIISDNPDIKLIDHGIAIAQENRDRIEFIEDKSSLERDLRKDLRGLVSKLMEKSNRE